MEIGKLGWEQLSRLGLRARCRVWPAAKPATPPLARSPVEFAGSTSADAVSRAPSADLGPPPVALQQQGALLRVMPLVNWSHLADCRYLLPSARQATRD